jgi:hypothetical protein
VKQLKKNNCPVCDRMKKFKVEFCDGNGESVTVAVSGQFSKERILQIIGLFEGPNQETSSTNDHVTRTSMDKIVGIIKSSYNNSWFTSKDISLMFHEQYHEQIKLSTISTYLSRMYANGYLERKGNRSCWQYRFIIPFSQDAVNNLIDDLKQK